MTAHVAEVAEQRGRVVLWLDGDTVCKPRGLGAAVRLAAAYGAEVETVFVARDDAVAEEGVPFRAVDAGVPQRPALANSATRSEFLFRRLRRDVESSGRAHGVAVRHAVASGEPVDRIAEMCLARGPWNIVALTRLSAFGGYAALNALLANVAGATGFLLCAGSPSREEGPIVVFTEDAERLPSMLRAAERLVAAGARIHLFIAAETRAQHADLDAHARLLSAECYNVVFEPSAPTLGVAATLFEAAARLRPSLIISPFGGASISDGRELARLTVVADAPVLIVR